MDITKLWQTGLLLVLVSFSRAQVPDPKKPETLPDKPPAWLDGYRIRYVLRVAGDIPANKPLTVLARIPTGGWLKPDGSDIAVQTAAGQILPVAVLSHDPLGDTIIQFKRNGNDRWYWVYGVSAKPQAAKLEPVAEGISYEIRTWEGGGELSSWPTVLAGLKKSNKVIGNGLAGTVIQNCNPPKPDQPRQFAASYRGTLDIKKPGVYRFWLNADDAAFLFIDGFKVYEQTGQNTRRVGQIPLKSVGADVELKAGPHPFEVHHVVGENPNAIGYCTLLWVPPEIKGWAFVPYSEFVPSLYGEVANIEAADKSQIACFAAGIDDVMQTGGVPLYLMRFAAQGNVTRPMQLTWDLDDGNTVSGAAFAHIYFKGGAYKVSLKSSPSLPPFQRNIYVWPAPGPTSPFSLGAVVKTLAGLDWKKFDAERLSQMVEFLLVSEQPERWPLLEKIAKHLLPDKELEPKLRITLHTALMEALAEQGKAQEALKLVEPAVAEYAKQPIMQVTLKLLEARLHSQYLKEPTDAAKIYQSILSDYRRLEHPTMRLAAINWGELYAQSGDIAKAGEMYRLAATLGGEKFNNTAQSEAVTRGALLRIAEQRLRSGDIRQCRQMLERIEMDYPEQKLEGLYRFLKAEADRHSGRYEEAIRSYEFLMKLTQWAGYRDRAWHGLADCYFRMEEWDKAQRWFQAVQDSYPAYYEKNKLADFRKIVDIRVANARFEAAFGKFEGIETDFEPGERPTPLEVEGWPITPGFAMGGRHARLFDHWPGSRAGSYRVKMPLPRMRGNGLYWVEAWYRDDAMCSFLPHLVVPQLSATIYGPKDVYLTDGGNFTYSLERTYGGWRKVAFKIKAPLAEEGRIQSDLNYAMGVVQLDGMKIMPISDRQNDVIQNFLEGTDKP